MATDGDFLQYSGFHQPAFKLGHSLADLVIAPSEPDELVTVTIQMVQNEAQAATMTLVRDVAVQVLSNWSPILEYQNAIVSMRAEDLTRIVERPDVYWIGERFEYELMDEVQGQILAGNVSGGSPTSPGYLAWLDGLGFSNDPADYPIVDIIDDGIGNGTVDSGDPTLHEFGDIVNSTRLAYVSNCTAAASGEGQGGHGHINLSIAGGFDTRGGFPFQDLNGYQRGLGINPYGRFAGTRIFAPSFDLSRCQGTFTGLINSSQDDGAHITSNSWGCSGCAGFYDTGSQVFDIGVRDADLNEPGNQEMIIFFSAGSQ